MEYEYPKYAIGEAWPEDFLYPKFALHLHNPGVIAQIEPRGGDQGFHLYMASDIRKKVAPSECWRIICSLAQIAYETCDDIETPQPWDHSWGLLHPPPDFITINGVRDGRLTEWRGVFRTKSPGSLWELAEGSCALLMVGEIEDSSLFSKKELLGAAREVVDYCTAYKCRENAILRAKGLL